MVPRIFRDKGWAARAWLWGVVLGMNWVFWEQVRLSKVLGIAFRELEGEAVGWGVAWTCRGVAGRVGWGVNRRAWGSREFRGGAARLVLFGA